ncbi:YfbM family protein [Dactylosporangium sp. NPDC000244]|uniref:YfbM family protein n=1 Tax=Dactylosporangium sp. NPDC000244 TaxID=3154365 RepID=UPI00332CF893
MGARGVYFALTDPQDEALAAARDDEEVMAVVAGVEEAWDAEWTCEVDKAWDAMHRCLTDGTLWLGHRHGGPLELAVLGGYQCHDGDDYIVAHVDADEVPAVAAALDGIGEAWLRERYDRLDPDDYEGAPGDEDFAYTWENLVAAREFYRRAAAAGRPVIFTVDQ